MFCEACRVEVEPVDGRCPQCLRKTSLRSAAATETPRARATPSWRYVALALLVYAWFGSVVAVAFQHRWFATHDDEALARGGLIALLLLVVRLIERETRSWMSALAISVAGIVGVVSIVALSVWIAVGPLKLSLVTREVVAIAIIDAIVVAMLAAGLARALRDPSDAGRAGPQRSRFAAR